LRGAVDAAEARRRGGVEAAEVAAAVELAGEFEVMEDAEDGLDDLHEFGGPRVLAECKSRSFATLRMTERKARAKGKTRAKAISRFPSGMTERKTKAKALARL